MNPRIRRHCVVRGILGAIAAAATAAAAQTAQLSILVPPTAMHAVEGITLAPDGTLYATSIHGQAVYRIDTRSGRVSIAVPSPAGESDDVAVGPPGTAAAGVLAWTAQRTGEIRLLRPSPGAKPEVVLRDVPRVNPIAFDAQGRLFTAQVGAGDETLWEIDVSGQRPARRVMSGQARLNGFGFGPDGRLYAPNFGADRILSIDVDAGTYTAVATGLGAPAAVKADARGDLWSVDYLKGDLWQTESATGRSRIVVSVPAPLDSLALAPNGRVFVSSAADSRILEVDPRRGRVRTVVPGEFTMALGMSLTQLAGREALLVADPFGYRYVDRRSGRVIRPPWNGNRGASYAIAASPDRIALAYALGGVTAGRVRVLERASERVLWESQTVGLPRGVALETSGDVLVLDRAQGRLLRLVAGAGSGAGVPTGGGAGGGAGARIAAPAAAAPPVVVATGLGAPVGLSRDRSATDSDTASSAPSRAPPSDATRAAEAPWLVTDFAGGRLLQVLATTGAVQVLATGLEAPTGAVRMRDGRLAVVEAGAGRVVAIDAQSGVRTLLASGLATSLDGLDLPADTPAGIAVGANGDLYVSCPGNNSIVRLRVRRAATRTT
jgi:sugar lactone lactonase YvrE